MKTNGNQNGHSAEVRMHLLVNGCSFPIAQLGPDFLILREPAECAPTTAEITLNIDGDEERWRVALPQGLHSDQIRTPVAEIGESVHNDLYRAQPG